MLALIIEDDVSAANALNLVLRKYDISSVTVYSGSEGIEQAKSNPYDIILLDMMLPDINGDEVIKILREGKIGTPVLVISALSSSEDKIKTLRLGADDYITKPFNGEELFARIKAVLKRSQKFDNNIIEFGRVSINISLKIFKIDNHTVKLTEKEYKFLELLVMHHGRFVSKKQVLIYLYGSSENKKQNMSINVFVCRVRKKLEEMTNGYNFIQTVWGNGYKLFEHGEKVGQRTEFFQGEQKV